MDVVGDAETGLTEVVRKNKVFIIQYIIVCQNQSRNFLKTFFIEFISGCSYNGD